MFGYIILGLLAGGSAFYLSRAIKPVKPERDASIPQVEIATLDVGLTLAEAGAVNYALKNEPEPKYLEDFSNTFFPTYPIAGALLHARAQTLGLPDAPINKGLKNAVKVPLHVIIQIPIQPAARKAMERAAEKGMIHHSTPIKTIGKRGLSVKPTNFPSSTYDTFWPEWARQTVPREWSGDVEKLIGGMPTGDGSGWAVGTYSRLTLSDDVYNLQAIGLARMMQGERAYGGGNVFDSHAMASLGALVEAEMKKVGAVAGTILKALAPIVGLIPGIGSGIAVAMSVAGSLALGQDISEAILDAAANAIPGGGLAKAALEHGVGAVKGIVKGKKIDEIALGQARQLAVDGAGELGGAAFDAGVAIAQGKNLQDAGFQVYYSWVRGNEIAERAGHFTESVTRAAEQGKDIKDFLIDETKEAMTNVISSPQTRALLIDNTISKLVKDPESLTESIDEVARKYKVPFEVAQAAFMSVQDLGNGIVVVNPEIRKRFDTIVLMPDRPMTNSMQNLIRSIEMKPKNAIQGTAKPLPQLSKATMITPDEKVLADKTRRRAQWVDRYRKMSIASAQS